MSKIRYSETYDNNFFINNAKNYEFVKQIRKDMKN